MEFDGVSVGLLAFSGACFLAAFVLQQRRRARARTNMIVTNLVVQPATPDLDAHVVEYDAVPYRLETCWRCESATVDREDDVGLCESCKIALQEMTEPVPYPVPPPEGILQLEGVLLDGRFTTTWFTVLLEQTPLVEQLATMSEHLHAWGWSVREVEWIHERGVLRGTLERGVLRVNLEAIGQAPVPPPIIEALRESGVSVRGPAPGRGIDSGNATEQRERRTA